MTEAILHVETSKIGSKCDMEIGMSIEEWNALTDDEQKDIMGYYMWNLIEMWVDDCD